jgi:hypothetical protein
MFGSIDLASARSTVPSPPLRRVAMPRPNSYDTEFGFVAIECE